MHCCATSAARFDGGHPLTPDSAIGQIVMGKADLLGVSFPRSVILRSDATGYCLGNQSLGKQLMALRMLRVRVPDSHPAMIGSPQRLLTHGHTTFHVHRPTAVFHHNAALLGGMTLCQQQRICTASIRQHASVEQVLDYLFDIILRWRAAGQPNHDNGLQAILATFAELRSSGRQHSVTIRCRNSFDSSHTQGVSISNADGVRIVTVSKDDLSPTIAALFA